MCDKMKFFGLIALSLIVMICIEVQVGNGLPRRSCHHGDGFPRESCCNECPVCRHHFDVEAPKDPGCRKLHTYHYDVEKFTDCHKETYDQLDAAVEVLPERGCRKSYHYHYDVEQPCCCEEDSYDTHDFEVLEPKMKPKCSKVKLQAYADHPVRECQCDCHNRRPYRRVTNPFLRRLPNVPRSKRKEYALNSIVDRQNGFVCHCMPSDQANLVKAEAGEIVGAPRMPQSVVEPAVYVGDASNPITYEQIKKHLDALPREEYNPTTNDVIGNLTVLFYDIYQQKHKKNFTLPLKYGTRTVIDQGDGLQKYEIEPIEGEYK
uniref:Uncharacterized protein n=1 Tax=Anopheles maculatus TaxID=74869 RepID=A0A182T377_9DIPT